MKSGSLPQGALGVEKLIVIHHSGKERGTGNSALGLRDAGIGYGGTIGRLDCLRPPDCLVQSDWRCCGGRLAGLSFPRIATAANGRDEDAKTSKCKTFVDQRSNRVAYRILV